jgi:GT2 family glycosyltransferase
MADTSKAVVASVVVATHNPAYLLARRVRALEQQTGVGPFEVIIVDDASALSLRSSTRRGKID